MSKEFSFSKLIIGYKISFIISFIVAYIGHSFIIYNPILNSDGYYFNASFGMGISYARFMLDLFHLIVNIFDHSQSVLPIHLFISLLIILLSTMMLYYIFDIKSKLYATLVSVFFVMSPAIVDIFLSGFCSVPYAISIFLTIYSVLLFFEKKSIYSIFYFSLGISIYQAYIPLWLTLIFTKILIDFIQYNDLKKCFDLLLRMFLILFLSLLLYMLGNLILHYILGSENSHYHGMTNTGVYVYSSIYEIFKNLVYTYSIFLLVPFISKYGLLNMTFISRLIYFIMICFIYYGYIYIYIYIKEKNVNILNIMFFILLMLLFPFIINFQGIIFHTNGNSLSIRVTLTLIFVFIIPILILSSNKIMFFGRNIAKTIIILLIVYIFYLVKVSNTVYYNSLILQNSYKLYCNRLVQRIQSVNGYKTKYKIAFMKENQYSIGDETFIALVDYKYIISNHIPQPGNFAFDNMLLYNNAFRYEPVSTAERKLIEKSMEYQLMDTYPNDNSIKIIDDIIVIKFK